MHSTERIKINHSDIQIRSEKLQLEKFRKTLEWLKQGKFLVATLLMLHFDIFSLQLHLNFKI